MLRRSLVEEGQVSRRHDMVNVAVLKAWAIKLDKVKYFHVEVQADLAKDMGLSFAQ